MKDDSGLIKKMAMLGPAAILVASSMGPGTVASCIMCYMLADMVGIPPDLNHPKFKVLLFCSILAGILGPFLSGLPAMKYMVLAMVVFLLAGPLVILVYLYVSNKKSIMGEHTRSWMLNAGLAVAFVLNCIGSVAAVLK